jgi:hypothetical protein
MVWIGLHGVMFLFLFSDFYKQAYNKKQRRKEADGIKAANGTAYAEINGNDGACMVSLKKIYFNIDGY